MFARVPAARLAMLLTTSVALALVAAPHAIAVPPASVICEYTGSKHKVKLTLEGYGSIDLGRGTDGRINVNGVWCDDTATVNNTDRIAVLAGDGAQTVNVHLANGGFKPGFTDEAGTSDEIEISIYLGGGDMDVVQIWGGTAANYVTVGKSSGYALGAMNLNANESSGIDADLIMLIGIEFVRIFGSAAVDTISGDGGAGTGDPAGFGLWISGLDGPDYLTGSAVHDYIVGGNGGDLLKGGGGPDYIYAKDGVQGNDEVRGGPDSDTCVADPGDVKISC